MPLRADAQQSTKDCITDGREGCHGHDPDALLSNVNYEHYTNTQSNIHEGWATRISVHVAQTCADQPNHSSREAST